MCLFTSARTAAIVFARSAGSEAMYCAGVLTFDGGFMDWSSSRTKCNTEGVKSSQRQLRCNMVSAMLTEKERETALGLLARSRQTLLDAIDGVTENQARW